MPDMKSRATIGIYAIQDPHGLEKPAYTHDHSICILQDGKVEQYLQLERHTRRKYDNQMHHHLESLIDQNLIHIAENADWVFVNSFVGSSFNSQNGRFRAETKSRSKLKLQPTPMKASGQFNNGPRTKITVYSIDHELAHVYSNLPFYGPFRENSLHVHFDGGASLSNCSVYLFRNGRMQLYDYHWDLGYLSKFYNDNALSFALLNHRADEHLAVPGKLMGFATMGAASQELQAWLRDHQYFKEIWNDHQLFYTAAKADFGWKGTLGDTRDPFLQNIAASFQQTFQEDWLEYLTQLQQKVKADFLYLSGGCALNIVANTLIVNSGLFQDVFIPPCPGDSGLSLGAAAFMEWTKHGKITPHSPYLNNVGINTRRKPPAPTPILQPASGWKTTTDVDTHLVQQTADAIAAGKIIGLYQGPGEVGPRALGNRSIIARPDSKALAEKVSITCKGREWYRPIAPVMLEKHAKRLTGLSTIHHLSQYMLLDFEIPEQNRPEIVGVVHANGTARIQTLFQREFNPFLWDLLTYLDEVHQIPALINTSFNAHGEPIVHTPQQAIDSANKMSLDALIINNEIIHIALPSPSRGLGTGQPNM